MAADDALAANVRYLLDRAAISDLLFRYASSLDTRDWERLETCFTPDVASDYGDLARHESREHLVRWVRRALSGFDVTHHMSTNHEITIEGDTARSRSYLHVVHTLALDGAPHTIALRGHYTKDYVRTAAGWRICRIRLETTWQEGDPGLFRLARDRWLARRSE